MANRIFNIEEIEFMEIVGYPVLPKSYLGGGSADRRDKWMNNSLKGKCGISRFEAMMYFGEKYAVTASIEDEARTQKKKFIPTKDLILATEQSIEQPQTNEQNVQSEQPQLIETTEPTANNKSQKSKSQKSKSTITKPDFLIGMSDSDSESDCEMIEEEPTVVYRKSQLKRQTTTTNSKFQSTHKPKNYKTQNNNGKHQFMKLSETFDANKLNHIIENFEDFKKQLRWRARYDEIDPFLITKRYLERSRHGVVNVDYKQKRGFGRFCAVKSMSLQTIPREIRHTISRDFYFDIDMVNAHPVILEYLCLKYGFNCDSLIQYTHNRETLLKEVLIKGKVADRDKAKQIYLSLTNGGSEDYGLVDNPSDHLRDYKDEMLRLHSHFAFKFPEKFAITKASRIKSGKDYNHEAGFMNTLLCDMENEILMKMYEFFGKVDNAVLCFDGIMLPNDKDYDISGCEKTLFDYFGIDMSIKQKTMNEHLDLTGCVIDTYEYPRLEYFADFRTLVKKQTVYAEWVEEWINNSFQIIENNGKMYYLTRNKKVELFADKTTETRDVWKPTRPEDIEKSLKVKCNVINMLQDFEFSKKYKLMTPKEKKELDHTREEITQLTHPYLKAKGEPALFDSFNLFTGFPLENIECSTITQDFTNSKFYNHLKTDFFDCKDELNHFLDHIADVIQDPAQIKGTSHLFYSAQGCGKGLLYKFMCKMLGIANTISIINTDTYFDKNFNADVSNKLLKVFEEVSEKGSAFKNHNRLKGEQTSEIERLEPKGIDPYTNRHCARFWYFTNNENSLYIENDDRRHTLHRVKKTHANNYDYFKPIWDEIKNETFLKSAFDFFASREYEEKNVMNAFTTAYKKDQKTANLSNGIKFIIKYLTSEFKLEDVDHKIQSSVIKDKYRMYCESQGIKYQFKAFATQIKKMGIDDPRKISVNISEMDDIVMRKFCYIINPQKIQNDMMDFLQDPEFRLDFD